MLILILIYICLILTKVSLEDLRLLAKVGISSEHCLHRFGGDLPTSTVIVNEKTGSRTIMHYRYSFICYMFILRKRESINA